MLAYHNDVKIKENILKQLQAHYEADEIIQGYYWENGKGCAMGCTLHSGNYKEYETRFGIPSQLTYVEDKIFEGLPYDLEKEWPIKFISAINVGADLSKVWPKFVIWLLSDPEYGVIQYTKNEKIIKFIENVINVYKKSLIEPIIEKEFISASAADYALDVASGGDASAVFAAAYAAASAAAAAAAYAAYAADAASAPYAASSAFYAESRRKNYISQSEKLIEILKNTF